MSIRSVLKRAVPGSLKQTVIVPTLLMTLSWGAVADDGWYTQAQADQGHQLFNNYCAQCHRPDLSGAAGPALVGKKFQAKWGKKTLGDLYAFEHEKMPAINPGSVPADQLWAITAYILEKNGLKAGTAMLGNKAETSKKLTFE